MWELNWFFSCRKIRCSVMVWVFWCFFFCFSVVLFLVCLGFLFCCWWWWLAFFVLFFFCFLPLGLRQKGKHSTSEIQNLSSFYNVFPKCTEALKIHSETHEKWWKKIQVCQLFLQPYIYKHLCMNFSIRKVMHTGKEVCAQVCTEIPVTLLEGR